MKQNSSIMFHPTRKSLTISYLRGLLCVAASLFGSLSTIAKGPEYVASYDPAKGFKPAQTDLSEIFLQIAGSLECHGSPVPYFRHVISENARVDAIYQKQNHSSLRPLLPSHVTEGYVNKLAANWAILSTKFGVNDYSKDVGHTMRDAIQGTRGTGTMIVEMFNAHQKRVFDSMGGKNSQAADFEHLKAELTTRLELDKTFVDEEKYEIPRRDAISYAIIIHGATMKLFKRLDEALSPADAERVKLVLTSVIFDVGRMAQSELEIGIAEWSLGKESGTAGR